MKKNLIITGANQGIGLALINELKNDFRLILIDREQIDKKEIPEDALFFKLDVSDVKKFKSAIAETVKKFGEIEVIINNAGEMNLSSLEEEEDEIIHQMVHSNILGVINGTKLVIESMKKNKQGTIINVASTAGKRSYPNHAVYCGTKYAVRGFSETMRKELIPYNIRVATMCPGAVFTDLAANGKTNKKYLDTYFKWRDSTKAYLQADDVSRAIKFMIMQPQEVTIREIEMTSTKQVE